MAYLLDISVCSQPIKRHPHLKAVERWDGLALGESCTSIVCLAEIEWGLHKLGSERRWEGYRRDVVPSLQVLPADASVWKKWAEMKARQQELGRTVADVDLLIAATAVVHRLVLATLNSRHFSRIEGLSWEDWSL
ncbi:MAG: type II toxin-antitoxin system VapC family toxin [Coraliomargarita sp.]